jgi:hypothetical protein
VASKAAKPKCCAYQPPVANRTDKYFFLLVRLNLPSHHACRWAPVHHRITLTSHDRSGSLLQPPISLYSPWPAALAFRRPPVYPSDSLLPQLALSSWIPSSGILQRCGKSGDSSCASSCWCVVRRRERCCAISWVPSSRNFMSTNSHATPFSWRCWVDLDVSSSCSVTASGIRHVIL